MENLEMGNQHIWNRTKNSENWNFIDAIMQCRSAGGSVTLICAHNCCKFFEYDVYFNKVRQALSVTPLAKINA